MERLALHGLVESEQGAGVVRDLWRADERALALAAYQQMFFGELVYGFAYRALADLEARCQFKFAGNQVAGLPLPCLQAL